MVQDTISTAILIIAVVVATTVVINAVYPAVMSAAGSVKSTAGDADSRSKTAVTISTYSFSPDYSRLTIWMKNSGREDIADPDAIRVYYGDDTGAMKNYHVYTCQLFAADPLKTSWGPGETLEISFGEDLTAELPHDSGIHRIKVVLPNGATSETTFTI
jgi:archaellum component FlaG (FlaF/FlaG flagellin family)